MKAIIPIALIILIILIFSHHLIIHGTLYDESNLISHEVAIAFLAGAVVALLGRWKK